jgi:hypothetical protein
LPLSYNVKLRLRKIRAGLSALGLIVVLLFHPPQVSAYSVLTHEAIVDTAWKDSIEPLLRQRFPHATAEQLHDAHAYAYGGCVIQDMGYYPFGSHFFTDLTHYVRSGDFVLALLRDAQNVNDYAFALGALAHYSADNNGHSIAINRAVPLLFPKLRRRYGERVTYADDHLSHLQTEFGFDVLQVARGKYKPDGYRDFIGFEVATDLLDRAFADTYALHLKDVFAALDMSVATYRSSVNTVIPKMTHVAWNLKKKDLLREDPQIVRDRFVFRQSRAEFEKKWGRSYRRPHLSTRVLAFFIRILPKIGPLKALAFHPPTPEAEKLFIESFKTTVARYRETLHAEATRTLRLPNENFDTGTPPLAGTYPPADDAYAQLVDHLAKNNFKDVPAALRSNILAYYRGVDLSSHDKKDRKLAQQLDRLRQ